MFKDYTFQCNAVGTTEREYINGTTTKCLGIICPKNHIFKPCTEGDGIKDFCVPCPSDRPVSIELFDSSKFHDPPVLSVCKNPAEKCTCKSDEAEIVNQGECNKTLKPSCRCKTKAGYFGTDPDLCELTKEKNCHPGFYLSSEYGVCTRCGKNMYKEKKGFEECIPQPECKSSEAVHFHGDSTRRRICMSARDKVTTTQLPYQDISTKSQNKDKQNVSVGPQPTGNVETTTAKPKKKQDIPILTPKHTIIILSAVLLVLFVIIIIVTAGMCWYCRMLQKKRKPYDYLHNRDLGLKQENPGYIRNSQNSSIVDISNYSKGHGLSCSEINDHRSQIHQFSPLINDRHGKSNSSSDYGETERTNTIEKNLVNQIDYTSDLNSTRLEERCEPDGKEEDTMDKKDTKFMEINHETFPMCKENNPQVKETEGKPMYKEIESLLNSAPHSSNLSTQSIGLQRPSNEMNPHHQQQMIQNSSPVHPDSGLGTQLPSPGMAELDHQPPLSLATFDE
ncbi:Hypothetical predicted protein [Mytilus galloprovincialis]|uniref:Uncharacterized protein n=1 Tax=Mytilus galloprovincialis TaxID=29158 RepID=A0A8B6FZ51_MYTGA|nr:Hypothetical predicted protein [Mytilus galloprovincialis]